MKLFLRYFLPITYFQATRLNRWDLVAYNGLVEWVPAIALSLFFGSVALETVGTVVLSYLAFICVYEIGYITNDALSESFEDDPRGRSELFVTSSLSIWALVGARVVFWFLISFLLGALGNAVWIGFHSTLLITFILHNSVRNEHRTATFFGLSTYRYFAPMILTLSPAILTVLLPTILLNNSLYRTTVYVRNKTNGIQSKPSVGSKLAFYAACMPLSIFLSVFFASIIPIVVCLYFVCIWLLYWLASKLSVRANPS